MTVGISLLTLVPGVVGGSETLARELTRALARVGELEYVVFVPPAASDAAGGLPVRAAGSYGSPGSTAARLRAMASAATSSGRLRRELGVDRLQAVHFPLTVVLPRVEPGMTVVTLHDVLHLLRPELFSRPERAYRRLTYEGSARRSRIVITPSEHARATAVERARIPEQRVRSIPHGVDHARFHPGAEPRRPLLLYPANRWPHKNHGVLLAALERVRRERPDVRLLLTGAGHDTGPAPPGVEVLGHVPAGRLPALYREAAALVFPSVHEGFGLPVLEAMASGCPVACSRIPALVELAGEAARYFDPCEPEDVAAAVLDVLADSGALAQRGVERAAGFTWEAAARAHEAVYRELLS